MPPFFPRTVAVPSDEMPSERAAWSRSDAHSTRCHSSSSPRLAPLRLACPELLLGSPVSFWFDRSSTDRPAAVVGLDFCPRRKMDASEGRRGDDLCESAGVVP